MKTNAVRSKPRLLPLVLMAIAALLLGISTGGAYVSLKDICLIFLNRVLLLPLPEGFDMVNAGLIWSIRLPRVLLAFASGASLAVGGAVMQSVLKNPLASSYTVGVSSGAGLGAVIVIVLGISPGVLGMFLTPVFALCFGMLTVVVAVYFASRVNKGMDNNSIILMGMVLSVFANAVMMTLAARNSRHAQQIILWQTGSFALKRWPAAGIVCAAAIAGTILLSRYVREMDLLTFGDEQAAAAGVEVGKTKWLLILLSAALAGISVAFAGVIGFVDLIAPHIIRRFYGASHKYVVPLSALFGGLFMVLADIVARTAASPSEIPVGSVTALIGAPFFAYIFFSKRRKGE